MKLVITKDKNYDQQAKEDALKNKCVACNGSGKYDSYDFKRNKSINCSSCNGTGKKPT